MTFFFSSRRRHTRSLRDWSSDVCSSDLGGAVGAWVNTGLLPLRLAPLSGEPARVIASGEVARFRFVQPAAGGRYGVRLSQIGRASCRARAEVVVDGAAES